MHPHTLTLTLTPAISAVKLVDFGVSTTFEATNPPLQGPQGTMTHIGVRDAICTRTCVLGYWVRAVLEKVRAQCEVPTDGLKMA